MAQTIYADGSGHKDTPLCLVGGWITSVNNWIEFGLEWKDFLKRRAITYLHQSASKDPKNDLWKSDPDVRMSVLDEAATIIEKSGAVSIAFWTPTADFDAYLAERVAEGFDGVDCFEWNAFRFVVEVEAWCKQRNLRMPEFVFESSGKRDEDSLRRVMADYGLPQPVFRGKQEYDPDRTVVALQAADFLAYELFKGWKDMMADGHSPRRHLHRFANMAGRTSWHWSDKQKMDALIPTSAVQLKLEAIVAERKKHFGS